MSLLVRSQSIPKLDFIQNTQNEDFVRVDYVQNIYILSDGAGGMGVESHLWSEYLANRMTVEPIKDYDAFNNWFENIWEFYFTNLKDKHSVSSPDLYYKLVSEGSAATLIAAWVGNDELTWLAYGDSVIMHLSGTKSSLLSCNMRMEEFLTNPKLLNFLEQPNQDELKFDSKNLVAGDIVLIASDAIGQYLLGLHHLLHPDSDTIKSVEYILSTPYRYANLLETLQNNLALQADSELWKRVLEELWEALADEKSFRQYTNKQLAEKLLAIDDYSLIMIKVE